MAFLAPVGMAIAGFFGTTGVAATAGAIAMTAGAGIATASLLSGPKTPGMTANPSAPTPGASLVDAQAQADARRRTSLLSGGLINPTGGKGSMLDANSTVKKTLLGE